MLSDTTQALISTASDAAAADNELQAAAQAFFQAAAGVSLDEANAAMRALAAHFGLEDMSRGGLLALICGAMVEQGCDASIIAAPLTARLQSLLQAAAELAAACVAALPETDDEEADPGDRFEQARKQLAPQMPHHNAAWEALDQFWRPAVAVFSVDPDARAAARFLRETADEIAEHHQAGHWLRLLLAVLDDEPILVLEPALHRGMVGRMSGVVENFQLHVLLMDVFPKSGFLSRRRVPKRVADIARGKGPQQTDDIVTGAWNLYTWEALQQDLTLPDPKAHESTQFWIWNEGVPDDIPVLDGYRVILLGQPSYPRTWRCQRMFAKLPANIDLERMLSRAETDRWMQRMLAAKGQAR